MCGKGRDVDAGAGEVCKADIVQDLRGIGMDNDQQEQQHGQRDQKAEQAADDLGQRGNRKQCDDRQHQAHQAAELDREEALLDVAFHREQRELADEDQPGLIDSCVRENAVTAQDQGEYNRRYDDLIRRFESRQAK